MQTLQEIALKRKPRKRYTAQIPKLTFGKIKEPDQSKDLNRSAQVQRHEDHSRMRLDSEGNFSNDSDELQPVEVAPQASAFRRKIGDAICGALRSIAQLFRARHQVNFGTRRFQLCVIVLFLLATMPTVGLHIALKVEFEKVHAQQSPQGQGNFDKDTLNSDLADSEAKAFIYSFGHSLVTLIFHVAALSCSQLKAKSLPKCQTPLLAQFALTGLIPASSTELPYYPLFTNNAILLAVLSLTNILFVARKTWQKLACLGVSVIHLALVFVQRQSRLPPSALLHALNVDQPSDLLVSMNSSTFFVVHFFFVMAAVVALVSLASVNLTAATRNLNELAQLQLDRLYEVMGNDQHAYVVTKSFTPPQMDRQRGLPEQSQHELGFQATYISTEFEKLFLADSGLCLENLVFRFLEQKELYASFASYDEEHSSINHRSHAASSLLGNEVKLLNLKQLVDSWTPATDQAFYEVKSCQQLVDEKNQSLQVPTRLSQAHQLRGADHQENDNLLRLQQSARFDRQRQQQRLISHESVIVEIPKVIVRVKVREVERGGAIFRIVTCKRIQERDCSKVHARSEDSSIEHRARKQTLTRGLLAEKNSYKRFKSLSSFQVGENSFGDHRTAALRRLKEMAEQLIKDKFQYISTISFCSEAIVFNAQKLTADYKTMGSRQWQHQQTRTLDRKQSTVNKQANSPKIRLQSMGSFLWDSQTSLSMQTMQKQGVVAGGSNLLPELEMYALNVQSSTQMLLHILETKLMCKKLVENNIDLKFEHVQGGPGRIARDIVKVINQVLTEKQITVRVSNTVPMAESLLYYWRIYTSLLFNLILWTANNSESRHTIFVEISLASAAAGHSAQQASNGHQMIRDIEEVEDLLEDKWQEQLYLRTEVFFEGDENYVCDPEDQRQIQKHYNFNIPKMMSICLGGHFLHQVSGKHAATQVILPLDQEVVEAVLSVKNSVDRNFWIAKNNLIYMQMAEQLSTTLLASKEWNFGALQSQSNSFIAPSMQISSSHAVSNRESGEVKSVLPKKVSVKPKKHFASTKQLAQFDLSVLRQDDEAKRILTEEDQDWRDDRMLIEEEKKAKSSKQGSFCTDSDFSAALSLPDKKRKFSQDKARRSSEEAKRLMMEPDKLSWQREIQMSLDRDDSEDSEEEVNQRQSQNEKAKLLQFQKKNLLQITDKVEGQGQIPKQEARRVQRLGTIREESRSNDSFSCLSGNARSRSISLDLPNNIDDDSDNQQAANDNNQDSGGANDDRSLTSYEMSVCMSESNIGGEAFHNMSEKYYHPLVSLSYVNPLASEPKSRPPPPERPERPKKPLNLNERVENGQEEVKRESAPDKMVDSSDNGQNLRHSDKPAAPQQQQVLETPKQRRDRYLQKNASNKSLNSLKQEADRKRPQGVIFKDSSERVAPKQHDDTPHTHKARDQQDAPESKMQQQESLHERQGFDDQQSEGHGEAESPPEKSGLEKLIKNESSLAAEPISNQTKCSCRSSCLVIDDICHNLIPIKLVLKRLMRIHIEQSTNGRQGLERYELDAKKTCCRNYFHFIIMDINMPVMDGLEATKRIMQLHSVLCATQEFQHVPKPKIIAVTAYQSGESVAQALAVGILEVLFKPIEPPKLLKCLRQHLTPELFEQIQN